MSRRIMSSCVSQEIHRLCLPCLLLDAPYSILEELPHKSYHHLSRNAHSFAINQRTTYSHNRSRSPTHTLPPSLPISRHQQAPARSARCIFVVVECPLAKITLPRWLFNRQVMAHLNVCVRLQCQARGHGTCVGICRNEPTLSRHKRHLCRCVPQ